MKEGALRVGYAILPGSSNGALEDLCLSTVAEDPLFGCVEQFIACAQEHTPLSHLHKSKLHAYLSVKNNLVGMKIGEAAKANAWNWEHPAMLRLKTFLQEL